MSWLMIPKWFTEIRGQAPLVFSVMLGFIPLILLVFFWWMVARGIPEERVLGPTILPSPAEVVHSLGDLFGTSDPDNRNTFDHIALSLRRVALGFLLCLVGVLMGSFGSARTTIAPVVTARGYIPIHRSLVMEPKVLLMDEPFSALDEPTCLEMQELIVQLWNRIQPAVVCVTHNVTEAVYLGERVWIFTHAPGQIAYDISDTIPHSIGVPPLVAQKRSEFKNAVHVVAKAFRRVSEKTPMNTPHQGT